MPIDASQWAGEFRENWSDSRHRALLQALYCTYLGLWLTATTRPQFQLGTNVFERDWDLLVILDACRPDALREVAPEYEFFDEGDVGEMWSVASGSMEWACKTFVTDYEDELSETVYLGANGYVQQVLYEDKYAPPVASPIGWPRKNTVSADDLQEVRNLHKLRAEDDLRVVPPGEVTDAAVYAGREWNADRYILHYNQPHIPWLTEALAEDRPITDREYFPWQYLRSGEMDYDVAWERYLDNLRLALDSVETLLENFDADTVAISADHGEAFGEWRVHGHPTGHAHPSVKKVPWVTTSGTDTQSYEPRELKSEDEYRMSDSEVAQQLEDLGYL